MLAVRLKCGHGNMEVSERQTPPDRATHEQTRQGGGRREVIRRADEDLHVLYLYLIYVQYVDEE